MKVSNKQKSLACFVTALLCVGIGAGTAKENETAGLVFVLLAAILALTSAFCLLRPSSRVVKSEGATQRLLKSVAETPEEEDEDVTNLSHNPLAAKPLAGFDTTAVEINNPVNAF